MSYFPEDPHDFPGGTSLTMDRSVFAGNEWQSDYKPLVNDVTLIDLTPNQ